MKRELTTMIDVLQHVEAVTIVPVSAHVLSLPDSLVDGVHVSEILNKPPLAIMDDASGKIVKLLPEKVFDARGDEIKLISGAFPVINIYDGNGNPILKKELIARMGTRLCLTRDQLHTVRTFVLAFISYSVVDICCYPGSQPNQCELLRHLSPDYRDLDWLQALKGNLAHLRMVINDIVHPHAWSYHYVRQNRDGSVSIERGFDYRVVKYYEREFAERDRQLEA